MRRKTTDDSLARAHMRVLHHARELVEEALVERHNETFYRTLVLASRALLHEIGAQNGTLAIIFQEALEEQSNGEN